MQSVDHSWANDLVLDPLTREDAIRSTGPSVITIALVLDYPIPHRQDTDLVRVMDSMHTVYMLRMPPALLREEPTRTDDMQTPRA